MERGIAAELVVCAGELREAKAKIQEILSCLETEQVLTNKVAQELRKTKVELADAKKELDRRFNLIADREARIDDLEDRIRELKGAN